ncbi:MAG: hypothetical protein APR63_09040 [Desulfuromonas sp. SDB]|nr:MAG: hypothetical protein APR63_09040 [Desulfuromonas sp. SDB]
MIILEFMQNIKEFFFNLSFSVKMLIGFASAFILYEVLKSVFARGKIIDGYILSENRITYLLLILDYEITHTSKSGMSLQHDFRVKKINLKYQRVVYEVKLSRFGSGMMGGYIKLFGMNPHYLFLVTDNQDLIVVDNKKGKRLCTKKQIIKKNPQLKDFNERLCVYSHIEQTIVIYDNEGYAYLLDPETVKAKKIKFDISPEDRVKHLSLGDLPKVTLDKYALSNSEPDTYFSGSNKYDIDFIPEPGSKRYFLHIKINFSSDKPKKLYDSFLNPKLLNRGNCSMPYLTRTPSSVVIAHSANLNPKIKDIYISRVSNQSEELWKKSISKIVEKPKFSESNYLYFTTYQREIYFIYMGMSSHKFSLSSVDKRSGKIIKPPRLFYNRKF